MPCVNACSPRLPRARDRAAARSAVWVLGGLAVAALSACAPTLNWRELGLEGTALRVAMPCRPSTFERQVALAGRSVTMHLSVCRAGEVTWAVGHADVQDPGQVRAALAALRAQLTDNLAAASSPQPVPRVDFVPRGTAVHPESGLSEVTGQLPDGTPAQARFAVFAVGTRVFQASAVASPPQPGLPALTQPFFSGLRVQP
jgi:hypothetical protein